MYGMVCKTIINHKMILIEVSLVQIGVGVRKSTKNSDFCGIPVGRYTPPGGVGGSPPAKSELERIWAAKSELAPQAKIFQIAHVFLKGNAFLAMENTFISKKNRLRRCWGLLSQLRLCHPDAFLIIIFISKKFACGAYWGPFS